MWEDEKCKKQAQKKDSRSVTKEITISVKIAVHDLAVKVDHMREFLEKKHSAKLWVKTKVRREEHLAAERKKQLRMLEEIARVWRMLASERQRRTLGTGCKEFGGCGVHI